LLIRELAVFLGTLLTCISVTSHTK
jgi:hypothetical protein